MFYKIRKVAVEQGRGVAARAGSRAPRQPARRYSQFTEQAVVAIRGELEREHREAGPKSIRWQLLRQGISPLPSASTVARILRSRGLVVPNPKKRPHSATGRFARLHRNELWQLDGIEWRLGGRKVTIYHVVDDCTRYLVALSAAWGAETSRGAITTLTAAMAVHGVPQSVLSDNGAAFNQHRQGRLSATERWLADQGARPISGRVAKPTTQGKIERAHQPVEAWLGFHPAGTLEQLQQVLDQFVFYYNNERQHQALGEFVTPQMAWNTVKVAPPLGRPIPYDLLYPGHANLTIPAEASPGVTSRVCSAHNRCISYQNRMIRLGHDMIGTVGLIHDDHTLQIYDANGVLNALIPWPQAGTGIITAAIPPFRVAP